jgi:prevent-host-death family protein
MAKRYSVAEARQHFTELLRRAERGRVLEITRRGRLVAVLVSAREYSKLAGERPSFGNALSAFRSKVREQDLLPAEAFEGLRDQSAGRNAAL